jgi:hypothetical protein
MALLYGRAGRLTAQNGGFRRGQDGSHLSVGPRMKMYHIAELEGPKDAEGCVGAPVSWY